MTLQQKYQSETIPALAKEFALANIQMVPKVDKIIVNMGLGEALKDKKVIDKMSEQLALITGQKPKVTRATKSISAFKLRAGMPIGLKVTLRGKRMYEFLERLTRIVLPRVRDFRGIDAKVFDGRGNMSIGFSEIVVFPEVNFESLDKIRGLEVVIVTTANNDVQAKVLLQKLGMPFKKEA
ncbi:50S ribosomal protein L5 [Candidatus Roizmanbacteria bacterium]|nr:50S ribosomal protein L5 [Candidatus Roizmanbacteria bacterium]